ncbi:hypothetical protein BC351_00285 [Paenibacillus ferrarius]|uniref:Uncharacterized protein n=1 Tax=Paenibacillus ferrarius TaxID=1469647 RepID=A0A1V4HT18_9BACL|nr:hypothetical protein [Paenibacillus ferrarius]OPH61715.1 hypothetical protein BC351_00285 [Paenibacillus ferrarius]
MKAKIYGHEVEGTPDEIAIFKQTLDEQQAKLTKPKTYEYSFYPPVYIGTPLNWTQITCNTDYK